jgi:hypothetical protein
MLAVRVRDQRQHLQHPRNLNACLASGFNGAGHGGSGGMRDFHRRPFVPV